MSEYVTIGDVKALGCMPPEDVDTLEGQSPGLISRVSKGVSGHADSMLAKRYGAPFQSPYPDALIWNLVQIVVGRLFLRRGYNPSSEQDSQIKEAHDAALSWLRDAADPEKGLVELPLKQQDLGKSAVTVGAPLAYSEASPYTWVDNQRDVLSGGGR